MFLTEAFVFCHLQQKTRGWLMKYERNYRDAGYEQGFEDGRITQGKINKKYVDHLLESKTQTLTKKDSIEYQNGWQEGFIDAIRDVVKSLVIEDGYVIKHTDKVYGIG